MKLTSDQVAEIAELIDNHDQDSNCYSSSGCCADALIELLKDILELS